MEGRLRKPHRREWPGFLGRLIPDSTWQVLSRASNRSMDPRTRWSPKQIVLCWVVMSWSVQGQLIDRFREGRETLSQMFYRRRRCGASYQGLTKATQRVGMSLFHPFWAMFKRRFPNASGRHGCGLGGSSLVWMARGSTPHGRCATRKGWENRAGTRAIPNGGSLV